MQRMFNFFYVFLAAILAIGATLIAEDITLTTYYPAPYGRYVDFETTGDTYLALTAAKRVGIGVSTPQNKMDVEGSVAIGATYSGTNTAPANGLIVQGQVGVATASPGAGFALDVNGKIRATTFSTGVSDGVSGTFVSQDGKTITVTNGIVTGII